VFGDPISIPAPWNVTPSPKGLSHADSKRSRTTRSWRTSASGSQYRAARRRRRSGLLLLSGAAARSCAPRDQRLERRAARLERSSDPFSHESCARSSSVFRRRADRRRGHLSRRLATASNGDESERSRHILPTSATACTTLPSRCSPSTHRQRGACRRGSHRSPARESTTPLRSGGTTVTVAAQPRLPSAATASLTDGMLESPCYQGVDAIRAGRAPQIAALVGLGSTARKRSRR